MIRAITLPGAVRPIACLTHVGWRSGVQCKRSIRDSTDRSARTGEPKGPSNLLGMEAGVPKAKPQTDQLGGRRGKKNREVNSPTPGNRCVGRPVLDREAGRPLFGEPGHQGTRAPRRAP